MKRHIIMHRGLTIEANQNLPEFVSWIQVYNFLVIIYLSKHSIFILRILVYIYNLFNLTFKYSKSRNLGIFKL